MKKYILFFLVILLFFSCQKKQDSNNDNNSPKKTPTEKTDAPTCSPTDIIEWVNGTVEGESGDLYNQPKKGSNIIIFLFFT